MVHLARQKDKGPIAIAQIAREEQISRKFLESILLSLRKNGMLGSQKGKGGGYYLIREPKSILMTDLMRILEGPISMVPCVSLNFYEPCPDCPEETYCSVNTLMRAVRDSTLEVYRNTTLADIL